MKHDIQISSFSIFVLFVSFVEERADNITSSLCPGLL